ncbi:MAG TPA: hypothetical protein VEC99_10640 [Clostridia bacterium]|nr:hypothetical protein [Clostridia bacterium]
MSFGSGRKPQTVNSRQRRLHRAQWWFQRMRQVVDSAVDWEPAPQPPPEQIWFPTVYRQAEIQTGAAEAKKPVSNPEERQICE